MNNWLFENPWWLLAGLIVIPVYYVMTASRSTVAFPSTEIMETIRMTWRTRLESLPVWLTCLAIVLIAIALARPQSPDATSKISREGIAIIMVIDRSGSMDARDLEKDYLNVNRLEVVKDVLRQFVMGDSDSRDSDQDLSTAQDAFGTNGRLNDMIGLVTFSGFADSVCPLTLDHGNLVSTVEEVKLADQSEGGTAIGEGIGLAVERLRKSKIKSKVIILLTDGVNNAGKLDPLKAGDLAAVSNIKVYCIGAGTNGYAPIPVKNQFTGEVELLAMQVEIDEATLKAISEKTGGKYFRATDRDSLNRIYAEIDEMEQTEVSELQFLRFEEHYHGFAFAAVLLLVASTFLQLTVFRKLC